MLRFLVHYGIHFVVPVVVSFLFFKKDFWRASLILLAGILIDVDHLAASPIFDANRCSIGFHPLHSYWAIGVYFILLFWRSTKIWGIAFLIHIVADVMDCLFIRSNF